MQWKTSTKYWHWDLAFTAGSHFDENHQETTFAALFTQKPQTFKGLMNT